MLSEKPRERCLHFGSHCLSPRELLALVLGTGPVGSGAMGLAEKIWQCNPQWPALIQAMRSPDSPILRQKGLGLAQKTRLMAIAEIAYRYSCHLQAERADDLSKEQVYGQDLRQIIWQKIPAEQRACSEEWLGFIPIYDWKELQDRSARKKIRSGDLMIVERGLRSRVNTDPAELFLRLLPLRSLGILLIHNHPSGELRASSADHELSKACGDLLEKFGLELFGHWIVTGAGLHPVSHRRHQTLACP